MERSKALTALSALAHDSRLDLVRLLMPKGDQGLAAGDIARELGLSASRLSFHLAAMEQAGLIRSRRVARNVIYSVDAAGIGQTIGYVLNDCCLGHPEVRACCAHPKAIDPQEP
ncbi:MAG: ArsR/SmtB family transcription factor [Paracoccaceae bacterium]